MLEILRDTVVVNPQSPPGWDFTANDSSEVSWFAYGFLDDRPYDGEERPSSYVIAPGANLSGFSFESVVGPGEATMYVQGWTPAPVADDVGDLDDLGYDLYDYQSPHVASKSPGKAPLVMDDATLRAPDLEGFIGYLNIGERETTSAPVLIVGKYSLAGEVVFRDTFHAELNGSNVTHLFTANTQYGGDFSATLTFENSNIKPGRNRLSIKVEGITPDKDAREADWDSVTFFIE